MASEALFAKVRERVKEYNLTEEEVRAIDTARRQISSHTTWGGITGGSVAFLLGKRKKFTALQTLALAGGGFLLGSQMGMISGAVAGAKTIKSLPNPQRLIELVKDVQREVIMAKGHRPDGVPRTVPPPSIRKSNQPEPEFVEDDAVASHDYARLEDGFQNDQAPATVAQPASDNQQGLSYYPQQRQQLGQQQQPQPNAWDKIRAENLPNNSWTKLRMEAQANRDDGSKIEQSRADTAKRLRERELTVEELPRTREELEQRGTARKNQWGDLI
ncbi:hypothetical protein EC973_008746 [Apophysomyces ossiformis]|uniref:Uncharacterized protein n=1 Tax=Apophysomyces ossiformis TaxID=679940 RepID=A0A8H7BWF6_9FUNG|nr:hypothetical protein EC973_008746 [Apophysomyces ossiformis]